jgi:hypothetical protein
MSRHVIPNDVSGAVRPALLRLRHVAKGNAHRKRRRLAPCERELAEWFQALTTEQQDYWVRLVRVLTRAEERGDEFTWKRFFKLAAPGWELATVLPELERPVGRRMRTSG